MKIIDFRLRPPFKDFLNEDMHLFRADDPFVTRFFKQNGFPIPESLKQQSMDLCLKEMEEVNIELAVCGARLGVSNDTLTELGEKYPQFKCVATYDVMNTEEGLNIIDKYIANGPLIGMAVETLLYDITYADDRIFPIYERMQELGKFVTLTTGAGGNTLELTKPEYIDKVARTFPNLNIIISHAGWPWVEQACWIAASRPNVYLMPDLYLCNAPGHQSFLSAVNYQLQDKVIYGSAYPYNNMVYAAKFALKYVRPEVQQKFMYDNAARILGLKEAIKSLQQGTLQNARFLVQ